MPEHPKGPKDDEPIALPIDGVLDLHAFHPRDVKQLVPDYLEECRLRGISRVRIIHGKGIGVQQRMVHAILERHPHVADFRTADGGGGGWGATEIRLRLEE